MMRKYGITILLMTFLLIGISTVDAKAEYQYDYNELASYGVRETDGSLKYGYMLCTTGKWIISPRFEEAQPFNKNGMAIVKVKGKYGVVNLTGEIVFPPQFDIITIFEDGLMSLWSGDQASYADEKGQIFIEPQAIRGHFTGFHQGLSLTIDNHKYGYFNKKGQMVIEPQFELAYVFAEGMAFVKVGDKYGFIDKTGQIVITPQFQSVGGFSKGLAAAQIHDKWGFINQSGQFVIAPQYQEVGSFTAKGLAAVKVDGKWGIINTFGKVVNSPQFDQVMIYGNGIMKIAIKGKEGALDANGKMLVPIDFDEVSIVRWDSEYIQVRIGEKWGYMDGNGQWIARPQFTDMRINDAWPKQRVFLSQGYFYDAEGKKINHYSNYLKDGLQYSMQQRFTEAVSSFNAALKINPGDSVAFLGLAIVRAKDDVYKKYLNGVHVTQSAEIQQYDADDLEAGAVPLENGLKYGYFLRSTGKWLTKPQFDVAGGFNSGGLASVNIGTKRGFVNTAGRLVIVPQYSDSWFDFEEGLNYAKINGKYGYIDVSGKVVIQPKYDRTSWFSEGVAAVAISSKYGYVDKNGHEVIRPQFDHAGNFHEGLAPVEVNHKWGFIDQTGKMVIPPQFDFGVTSSFSEGLAQVAIGSKYGYINHEGEFVIPLQFDHAHEFQEGAAAVTLNGKEGLINQNGVMLVETKYDMIDSIRNGLAKVVLNGKIGYLDKSGQEVIAPQFDRATYLIKDGIIEGSIGNRWGCMDKNGKWVVGPMKFTQPISKYWLKQNILTIHGYYYDMNGSLINHYMNKIREGYYYLNKGDYLAATSRFEDALVINPGDDGALWGLIQIKIKSQP